MATEKEKALLNLLAQPGVGSVEGLISRFGKAQAEKLLKNMGFTVAAAKRVAASNKANTLSVGQATKKELTEGKTTISPSTMNLAKGMADYLTGSSRTSNSTRPLPVASNPSQWDAGNLGPYKSSVPAQLQDSWMRTGSASPTPSKVSTFQDTDKANRARVDDNTPVQLQDSWMRTGKVSPAPVETDPGINYNDYGLGNIYAGFEPEPLPAPPEFNFTLNDFSKKANKLVAKAYSPQYEAIENAKQQAQSNYDYNRQVIDDLYRQQMEHINSGNTKIDEMYSGLVGDSQARTTDSVANIGNMYSAANADTAASLGAASAPEGAAAEIAARNAGNQSWLQSLAQMQGDADTSYLTQQQAVNADYGQQMSNASATGNRYSQQQLLGQLSQALMDQENRRLGIASDQSITSLQLGQDMQGRDLDMQKLNYGALQDLYNNKLNAANSLADQRAAYGQNQVSVAQMIRDLQNDEYKRQQDQLQYGLDTRRLDQADSRINLDVGKLELDAQRAAAQRAQQESKASAPVGSLTKVQSDIAQYLGVSPSDPSVQVIFNAVRSASNNFTGTLNDSIAKLSDIIDTSFPDVDSNTRQKAFIAGYSAIMQMFPKQ